MFRNVGDRAAIDCSVGFSFPVERVIDHQGCSGGGSAGERRPLNTSEASGTELNVPKIHAFPNHFSIPECAKGVWNFNTFPGRTPLSGEEREGKRGKG